MATITGLVTYSSGDETGDETMDDYLAKQLSPLMGCMSLDNEFNLEYLLEENENLKQMLALAEAKIKEYESVNE